MVKIRWLALVQLLIGDACFLAIFITLIFSTRPVYTWYFDLVNGPGKSALTMGGFLPQPSAATIGPGIASC